MTTRQKLRVITLAVVSPLTEKNPRKLRRSTGPAVLSMSRLIVLGFAVAMVHQLWIAAAGLGWPDATLSVAIVLALPILSALEHAHPAEVLEVAKTLVGRLGVGEISRALHSVEPSKYDDHTDDRTNSTQNPI